MIIYQLYLLFFNKINKENLTILALVELSYT